MLSATGSRQAIRRLGNQRMVDVSSSETVLGVPPNEKEGFGATGRAGGSGTVTEARVFV
jgi:hypothetical protein